MPSIAQQVVKASAGNPLFVEEFVAMLNESPEQELVVPPSLHALLAARLDQLDDGERTVLSAAAVEGQVFHRAAVQALAPDEDRLTSRLTALVRKELIRPDTPQLAGEDGFRFHHLLLREVAYDAISKTARFALHERYADWLGQRAAGLDAFVGYHLEQAYGYRVEVGSTGPETDGLALRAASSLERAATAALGRSDAAAAIGLLERAAALPPVPDRQRARLLTDRRSHPRSTQASSTRRTWFSMRLRCWRQRRTTSGRRQERWSSVSGSQSALPRPVPRTQFPRSSTA